METLTDVKIGRPLLRLATPLGRWIGAGEFLGVEGIWREGRKESISAFFRCGFFSPPLPHGTADKKGIRCCIASRTRQTKASLLKYATWWLKPLEHVSFFDSIRDVAQGAPFGSYYFGASFLVAGESFPYTKDMVPNYIQLRKWGMPFRAGFSSSGVDSVYLCGLYGIMIFKKMIYIIFWVTYHITLG